MIQCVVEWSSFVAAASIPVGVTFTNMPGDNPVYGVCDQKEGDIIPINMPNHSAAGSIFNGAPKTQSFPEHEFDNPIYGDANVEPPLYESLEGENVTVASSVYTGPAGENIYECVPEVANSRSPVQGSPNEDSEEQLYDDVRPSENQLYDDVKPSENQLYDDIRS